MLVGMRGDFEFEINTCWKTRIVVHKLILAVSLPIFHFCAPGIPVYVLLGNVAF